MSAGEPRLFAVRQEQLTSDDYYTPPWVFERMGLTFDLDVCAPPGGVTWIPANRYFTQEDDGLAQLWHGRVWMNPPYSNATPWVERFIAHRNGVCLVPHAKSGWHVQLWTECDGAALVRPFEFVGGWPFLPVWFAAFSDECVDAIGRLGVVRRVA